MEIVVVWGKFLESSPSLCLLGVGRHLVPEREEDSRSDDRADGVDLGTQPPF